MHRLAPAQRQSPAAILRRGRALTRSENMNAKETGMVLEMITAHYWQTPKTAERNAELMVRTWQRALADIPLRPHIELALDDWFRHEQWPPQVAELRERALELGGPTPTMIADAQAWRERSLEEVAAARERHEARRAEIAEQREKDAGRAIEEARNDPDRPPTVSPERWATLLPDTRRSLRVS
ncbi:MAG: replicative helicase loader/inhibitor [Dehalococcoidia bacterium]